MDEQFEDVEIDFGNLETRETRKAEIECHESSTNEGINLREIEAKPVNFNLIGLEESCIDFSPNTFNKNPIGQDDQESMDKLPDGIEGNDGNEVNDDMP